MYLNTVSIAGNTKKTFPKIILIIAFVVGVILVIYYFGGLIKSKKCLAKLQQSEYLEETAQQVEMSDYVQVGKNVALVCDKMVLFPSHHYAIAFDEIVWIYKKITKYNGIITSNTDLLLYNKDKKCVKVASVFGGDKNDYVGKLAAIISVKTPNVLVGYNKDNITLYNSYRKTGELPKPIEHPQDSMM